MKRQKRIIASILTAAFLIGGTTSYAGRVSSMLTVDKSSVSTAILGNTTGLYRFTSSNSTASKYYAEAYMYVGADSSKITHKVRKYSLAPNLKSHSADVKVSRNLYTVARAYTYGNTKDNPLKGCIASTMLSNQ